MNLQHLLKAIPYMLFRKDTPIRKIDIHKITCNSKEVEPGDLFVCVKGNQFDGHDYIEEARNKGAVACVVERNIIDLKGIIGIRVKDTKSAYSHLSAAFFSYPATRLKIIGITGTKGKTTVAHMVAHMLKNAGIHCGIIGTLGIEINDCMIQTKNTTPDAFTIHKYFAKMVDMGCKYAIMEVSSQSIKEKRVEGIPFEVAVFTNFSEDHIGPGEHKNIREYRYYKSRLFKNANHVIGNLDDIECKYMFQRTSGEKYGFTCLGTAKKRVLKADHIQYLLSCGTMITRFMVEGNSFEITMPGEYNVYNVLAALSVIKILGISCPTQKESLKEVVINGRMQRVSECENIACYIDYAHNEQSLISVLKAIKAYRPERIILVFGCGGNRAKGRRIRMGIAAGENADFTIITSDNPRYEEPGAIIKDILIGIRQTNGTYQVIDERCDAVKYAISIAQKNDVVLIAGKGHETYQEIEGKRVPMSDYELAVSAYRERNKGR